MSTVSKSPELEAWELKRAKWQTFAAMKDVAKWLIGVLGICFGFVWLYFFQAPNPGRPKDEAPHYLRSEEWVPFAHPITRRPGSPSERVTYVKISQ